MNKLKSPLAIHGGKRVRTKLFPAYNTVGAVEERAVRRVLQRGVLSQFLGTWHPDFYGGPEVRAFEKEWAKYFRVKHAIAVNSATSGLIAAAGAAGLSPGDEVIVSPYTMAASVTSILFYGAIPVFADVEPNYFCLDPRSVEACITPRTKAIVVVDIFGQPYDARAIRDIATRHKLIIIEDCAQAPGSMYGKQFAGTLGDIGVYSLNYHKHIHTGEGGIVVTNNDDFADRVRLIRNHAENVVSGKSVTNLVNMVGFNFRMTEIEAAIGRAQLRKLARLVAERQRNCRYVARALTSFPGITEAPTRPGASHVYYVHPFLYDESVVGVPRDRFIAAVKAELPESKLRRGHTPLVSVGYVKPLYLLPLFQQQIAIGANGFPFTAAAARPNYAKGICPVAERLHERELFFHELMRPGMTRCDMDDVIAAFRKVYEYRATLL